MSDDYGAIIRRLDRLEQLASRREDRPGGPGVAWTPTVIGSTSAGTATYSLQAGTYVTIGSLVIASAVMTFTGHTGTGNMTVGLPFVATSVNSIRFSVPIWLSDIPFTGAHVQGQIIGGASVVSLEAVAATGTRTAIPMDTAGSLIMTAIYETA